MTTKYLFCITTLEYIYDIKLAPVSCSILSLLQGGLIQHWYKQRLMPDPCVTRHNQQVEAVTLRDIGYVVALLGAGLALALVAFMAEVLFGVIKSWKIVSNGDKSRNVNTPANRNYGTNLLSSSL